MSAPQSPIEREQQAIAKDLRLRGAPAPVARVSRKALIVAGAVLSAGLAGAIGWSLTEHPKRTPPEAAPQMQMMRMAIGWGAFALGFVAALSLARKLINPPELSPEGEALAWKILDLRPTVENPAQTSAAKKPRRAGKTKGAKRA